MEREIKVEEEEESFETPVKKGTTSSSSTTTKKTTTTTKIIPTKETEIYLGTGISPTLLLSPTTTTTSTTTPLQTLSQTPHEPSLIPLLTTLTNFLLGRLRSQLAQGFTAGEGVSTFLDTVIAASVFAGRLGKLLFLDRVKTERLMTVEPPKASTTVAAVVKTVVTTITASMATGERANLRVETRSEATSCKSIDASRSAARRVRSRWLAQRGGGFISVAFLIASLLMACFSLTS